MLGVVWAVCAASAVTTGAGAPVAAAGASELVAAQVQLVRTSLRDQRTFAREVSAPDRFDEPAGARAPSAATATTAPTAPTAPRLLGGLQGKDVLLVFVEAYGRVALEGPAVAPAVTAVLDDATAGLRAAGISSRSAYLTSPVFGGGSWLAHATLQSGLWIDDESRYDQLLGSGRLTLTAAFRQAGWRTVLSIPSSPSPWPEGQALYRFDVMYGTEDLGYDGPAFSFAQVPDQFTLHALHTQELAVSPRRPVMAEVDLVSSHAPWAPLPRLVPWQDLGDGTVFEPMPEQGRTPAQVLRTPERTAAAYGESIAYSLTSLVSYLRTFPDRDRVVIMLGDHQPTTAVPGSEASRDVPVTILAQDPTVLSRITSWGWQDGVRPRAGRPGLAHGRVPRPVPHRVRHARPGARRPPAARSASDVARTARARRARAASRVRARPPHPPGEFVGQEGFMLASEIPPWPGGPGSGPGRASSTCAAEPAVPDGSSRASSGAATSGSTPSPAAVTMARERAGGLDCRYTVAAGPPGAAGPATTWCSCWRPCSPSPTRTRLLAAVHAALPAGGRFACTVEVGEPLTEAERAAMPDADTVWLTTAPELAGCLERAGLAVRWQADVSRSHSVVVDALLDAFRVHADEIDAAARAGRRRRAGRRAPPLERLAAPRPGAQARRRRAGVTRQRSCSGEPCSPNRSDSA